MGLSLVLIKSPESEKIAGQRVQSTALEVPGWNKNGEWFCLIVYQIIQKKQAKKEKDESFCLF
jgi:hypothetical protein